MVGRSLGGKEGAFIGVVLGGGGAVVATKGEDVELPAGTLVTVRLDRPLAVPRGARVPRSTGDSDEDEANDELEDDRVGKRR